MSGSVFRRHIGEGAVSPKKLHSSLHNSGYFHLVFPGNQIVNARTAAPGTPYGAPTGADEDVNVVAFSGLLAPVMYYQCMGAQAILSPTVSFAVSPAVGLKGQLDAGLDAVALNGVAYYPGGHYISNRNHPLGTKLNEGRGDKFVKATFYVSDISEVKDVAVGFARTGGAIIDLDDYEDSVHINANGVEAAGRRPIQVETQYDDGGTRFTDTGLTLGDDEQITFEVHLLGDNELLPRFFVNGKEFFDHGATLFPGGRSVVEFVPFILFFNVAAGTGSKFFISEIEAGDLADVSDDGLA